MIKKKRGKKKKINLNSGKANAAEKIFKGRETVVEHGIYWQSTFVDSRDHEDPSPEKKFKKAIAT